ncbi:heterokaryon incompatibility protein-domain-containing protein [Dactylonectria macrodidyma]|uniref:Heterokaryon incompatibility protein-domain-containing protein n=1 Tax=Dactylonectria macrodidyma TaxID=307937 RepID=A0A9P9EEB6_9HYPO|nr:heterokaryon incompatibility protein-domain-containing protein [Dactylonectria macrodidyma]
MSIRPSLQPPRPFRWTGEFIPLTSSEAEPPSPDYAVVSSVLCPKCEAIRSWAQTNLSKREALERPLPQEHFRHHDSGTDLQDSYASGCHLCTLIWWSFSSSFPEWSPDLWIREAGPIGVVCRFKGDGLYEDQLQCVTHYDRLVDRQRAKPGLEMTEIPQPGDPNATLVREKLYGRRLRLTGWKYELPTKASICTKSASIIQLAQRWIKDCTDNHCKCSQKAGSKRPLPTRLIDVGPNTQLSTVRLVSTRQLAASTLYIALSYCWGGTKVLKLTAATEKELKRGVSISRLPRTIQDAVWVTPQLDMRYIWVDSIYIIQDSPADWGKEAASMGDVYRNCHFAIAALGAWSSTEGLFTERDPLAVMPCRLYTDANGHDINIDGGSSVAHLVCFDDAPLHTRAWVVQERILAPRTLNFGAILAWECRELRRSDLGMHEEARLHKATFYSFTPHNKGSMPSDEEREAFRRFWEDDILLHYTHTRLTKWTDRLVAISGLIQDLEERTGWESVCGLWKPILRQELCWTPLFKSMKRVPGALTWSWGSVSGDICHRADLRVNKGASTFVADIDIRPLGIAKEKHSVIQRIPRLVRRVLDGKDQQQTMALRISSLLFHMNFDTRVRGRQVGFHEVLEAHHDCPSFDGEISITGAPPTYYIKIWNDVTPVREGPYLFVPLIGAEATLTLRREPIHFGLVLVQLRTISWAAEDEGAVGVYERVGFAEVKLVGGHKIDERAKERTCVLVI